MNPVYSAFVVALTFGGLVWFILSGQPTHLTVTFVFVTLALGLGATYIMTRQQAQEILSEGDDRQSPAASDAMSANQIPDREEDIAEDSPANE